MICCCWWISVLQRHLATGQEPKEKLFVLCDDDLLLLMDLRPSKTFSDRSRTVQQSNQYVQRSNKWYPQGKNISLHIRSTGFQANWEGGIFRSKDWLSEILTFPSGGILVWNSRKGLSGEFLQIFSIWGMSTETCLCMTDSMCTLIILIHHGYWQI